MMKDKGSSDQEAYQLRGRGSTLVRHLAILLAIVPVFVPLRRSLAQPPSISQIIDDFETAVESGVDAAGDGCVMIAVFRGSEIIWSQGFGQADIDNNIAATSDTIGRIGSITKSLTAVVLCQLVEQRVLDLDDPVRRHFPEIDELADLPKEAKPITYRMLASHTAGLAREPKFARLTATGPIHLWEDKILQAIPNTSLESAPLTEFQYSNIGYGILGLAASRAADKPYMLLVEEQIFDPLAMRSSTFFIESDEMKQRLAVGYTRNRFTGRLSAEVPTKQHAGRGYKVPNGGIYSTVSDLAAFAAAMMGETKNEILTKHMREQVFLPQPPAKRYGLGFKLIAQTDDLNVVGHSGSVAGYRADLRFDLHSRWGVAVLATSRFNPPIPKLFLDLTNASAGAADAAP